MRAACKIWLAMALVLVAAAGARGAGLEILGLVGSPASLKPSCPVAPCEVITDTTGFQAAVVGRHNTMVVARAGRVMSWTVALAAPTSSQVAFFDRVAHGPAQASIVVLHQGAGYRFRVTGASPLLILAPFFGKTTAFNLARPLAVAQGDVIGLSVPTWAPALAIGLDPATAWRSSRARGTCGDVFRATAQTTVGALAKYQCIYRTARLTYAVTVADGAGRPPTRGGRTAPPPRAP